MATTTLGVKLDEVTRGRLSQAVQRKGASSVCMA